METTNERRLTSSPRTAAPSQPQVLAPDAGLDDLVEAIVAWTHAAVGNDGVVQASERFHVENGKVFHDDSFYDTRTAYFFDQFVF